MRNRISAAGASAPAVSLRPDRRGAVEHPYRTAFLLGAVLYVVCVIPFLIYHGGIFFYYGDYNVQQVPFYILAHRAVREGRLFWSPYVDLGGSMGGSFAFYLWGSPFFWITIPFPEAAVPYLLPFLMAAKYGTATLTGFALIRRGTKTDRAALIGALLYAFSGFQACNIVFQHFHDVVAFFPLYVLSFDDFLQKKKRIPFTLMTAFMVILNYYFFVGEVVFFLLYYAVRYVWADGIMQRKRDIAREVLSLLGFGALGLGAAAFFLVQSLEGVVGNTRVSNWISGYDWVRYPDPGTPLAILKSFFVAPDLIAKGTMFSSDAIKCGSVAAYLPCFGVSGAAAYFAAHRGKRNWKKRLSVVFLACAFIPLLNAMFSAFNSAYYARWFYLPVLLMASMTAESLEEADTSSWKIGAKIAIFGLWFFTLCGLIPKYEDGSWSFFSLPDNPEIFWMEILGTALTVPFMLYILFGQQMQEKLHALRRGAQAKDESSKEYAPVRRRHRPGRSGEKGRWSEEAGLPEVPEFQRYRPAALVLTAFCCALCTMTVMLNGTSLIARTGGTKWRWEMLDTRPALPDEKTFARVETDGTSTNYEMVWGYPTIHAFESTVTPSIQEFYDGIGIRRSVESELPWTRVGARQILSVRYELENLIISSDEKYSKRGGLPGYTSVETESPYYAIYENQHFIPMGFTFEHYVTESEYKTLDAGSTIADRLLVRDLILPDETAASLGLDIGENAEEAAKSIREDLQESGTETEAYPTLAHDDIADPGAMSIDELERESDRRAASACTSFVFDNGGFTAETADLDARNLVFFSVPYSRGWTAFLDGEKTEVIRADFGLMAVAVPEGVHHISFRYEPYGFRLAVLCSVLCAALICVIALIEKRKKR